MAALISSPDITKRAKRLQGLNVELLVRDSAVRAAKVLVKPMKDAAKVAGASREMLAEIKVHDGHLNELVMLEHGTRGDVIVGVDGRSRAADEAQEKEWGGIDERPHAWVRQTVARERAHVTQTWSHELTTALDRKVLK